VSRHQFFKNQGTSRSKRGLINSRFNVERPAIRSPRLAPWLPYVHQPTNHLEILPKLAADKTLTPVSRLQVPHYREVDSGRAI
jgi:predicted lipase